MKTRLIVVLFMSLAILAGCGKKKEEKTEATEQTAGTTSSQDLTGTLKLSKTEYNPSDEIKVTFTADGDLSNNAWVGLIPSNIPHGDEGVNDANDMSYKYVTEKGGEMTFNAPLKPGKYDLRMNSGDKDGSKEVASVTFTVVANSGDTVVSLSLDKGSYKPGEEIKLDFRALPDFDANAWIGIIPSDIDHGSEAENDAHDIAYQYISSKTKGTMTFKAPEKPGKYDFRMMNSDNSDAKEMKYVSFTVK